MGGLEPALLIAVTAGVCFFDIKEFRIPDFISLGAFALGFLITWINHIFFPWQYLIASGLAFITYLSVYFISKRKFGPGDVKLSLFLGGVNGIFRWYALNILAIAGGLVFYLILYLTGRKVRERPVPFGPFLCIASLIVYFLLPAYPDLTAFFR